MSLWAAPVTQSSSSPSSTTTIILVSIFALGLVLVILVPFVWDICASHKTWRIAVKDAIAKDPAKDCTTLEHLGRPVGIQGLARATMAYAVIVVIGFALAYILIEKPFGTDSTIAGNIIVALTTTLAAITAFYFGSKMASDANQAKTPPKATPTTPPTAPTGPAVPAAPIAPPPPKGTTTGG